ncbi:unnamed protein product [Phytomonas sp. EM1]|nr:unnamed protein product [Phytomonas sp. EM1]|eukprot:CCW64094.1 unnamed protein product [Phytomonas sp. isolate EM1]
MADNAAFQLDNLEDLESIELSDEFIRENMDHSSFKEDHFRQTLNSLCESFVMSFLGDEGVNLVLLYNFFKESSTVLTDIQKVLQAFISQLDSIQADIGSVRESLVSKGTTLKNILSTEAILSSAISRLVIPPEVVQVITQSNEQQLGTQFKHCVKELLRYLQHREAVWNYPAVAACSRQSSKDAESFSHDEEPPNKQEMHIPFTECRVYNDLMNFMDSLTLFACWKIKSFLSHKLQVLTIKGTNIWIQQENVLKPFSFYVYFLQHAASFLSRRLPRSLSATAARSHSKSAAPLYPLVRHLYEEFRAEYRQIMLRLYLKRVQDYVLTCRLMEFTTMLPERAKAAEGDSFYALPLLTAPAAACAPELLRLGGRGEIFRRLFSPPLIPVVERANHRRHSYEETFRSILSVMCDIATHEYLFTCDFFSGDALVFVEVFCPAIQFVVDYVAEVVLSQGNGEVRQMLDGKSSPFIHENVEEDTYGLLIMIRLCYEFRSMMRHVRKLYCLDGFFDSLLRLLLPVYKENLEKQFVALRGVEPMVLAQAMSVLPSTEAKLREVHPLVKSFTEFSCAIMSLLLGLLVSEERLRAEDELHRDKLLGGRLPESDMSSSFGIQTGKASRTQGTTGDSFDELRELALQRFAEEEESEASDIINEFMMLVSKLEFIRQSMIQLFQNLSRCILADEKDASVRDHLEPLQSCYMLNNIFYILQQYHQHQIILSETNPTESIEEDGMVQALKGEEFLPLDTRDNFQDLKYTYLRYRAEFVENMIRKHLPAFFAVIQNGESCSVNEIKEATDSFMLSWQDALDSIVKTVHRLISDPVNAQQIAAQICMDILLYNTRFHGLVAKAFEKDREAFDNCPLRSLIVTNQTVLQFMRKFLSSLPLGTDE